MHFLVSTGEHFPRGNAPREFPPWFNRLATIRPLAKTIASTCGAVSFSKGSRKGENGETKSENRELKTGRLFGGAA